MHNKHLTRISWSKTQGIAITKKCCEQPRLGISPIGSSTQQFKRVLREEVQFLFSSSFSKTQGSGSSLKISTIRNSCDEGFFGDLTQTSVCNLDL